MNPQISVVVPSFNRKGHLLRLLATLSSQTLPATQFEVVIVLDGSTDDSAAAVVDVAWPFHVEVIEQPNAGPGAARNSGAARAKGSLLAFIDDDIQLDSRALAEHTRALETHPGAVAIGRVQCEWTRQGMGQRGEGYWRHFEELKDGAPLSFRDCYGCNLSMETTTFRRLGGFYAPMRRLEDTELGFRAECAGIPIIFAREALATHDAMKSPIGALNDAFASGVSTVVVWRDRPEFLRALSQGFRRPRRSLVAAIVSLLIAVPLPQRLARWIGDLPDVPGIRSTHSLLWYRWYLRGARSEAGSWSKFREFLGRPIAPG